LVALITGASSGIGLAVAEQVIERGGKVALVARRQAELDKVVARFGADRAIAFATDVKDLARLTELPRKTRDRFGRLDLVVNNAGLNHRGPIVKHSAAELADIITTNLTAPVALCRAAVDVLGPGGCIVNVASIAGMVPLPDEAAYSASKAGLRAFSRAIREEHPELKISIVSPGPVDTTFFGDVHEVPNIVFSQPMHSAAQVADAILRCVDENPVEIALPGRSGKLATVGYVFPSLARALRPLLEKLGARNKARYAREKGL
jgi:short-subunit dehydrogenase